MRGERSSTRSSSPLPMAPALRASVQFAVPPLWCAQLPTTSTAIIRWSRIGRFEPKSAERCRFFRDGRVLGAIRVGGPRVTPVGPIERLRSKLRVIVVRDRAKGALPFGTDETSAKALARRQIGLANSLWGQCGITFGPEAEADIRIVDPPPTYLLSVGCDLGLPASGGEILLRVEGREVRVAASPENDSARRGARSCPGHRAGGLSGEAVGERSHRARSRPHHRHPGAQARRAVRRSRTAGGRARQQRCHDDRLHRRRRPLRRSRSLRRRRCAGRHGRRARAGQGVRRRRSIDDQGLHDPVVRGGRPHRRVFHLRGSLQRSQRGHRGSRRSPSRSRIVRAGPRARAHPSRHAGHPDDFGVDVPTQLMDSDAADPSAFGPRRLTVIDCARAYRQSGPGASIPLLSVWPLTPAAPAPRSISRR